MGKGRLEAFSDGVIAIIITIMVLEMKVPHGADIELLEPVLPVFLSYILSFIYIGIYWNNHHHMLHASKQVNGRILWANMHLLFWLSLTPFASGWMGRESFCQMACDCIWSYFIDVCYCIYDTFQTAYKASWKRFYTGNSHWLGY